MKKILLSVFLLVCIFNTVAFAVYPTTGSTQDAYCVVPPYLTLNVKPNINLVLDHSGSMRYSAYDMYAYVAANSYYGNFKDDLYYRYNAAGYWEENVSCVNIDRIGSNANGCVSGNLLNWATTSRTDILRRILSGGKLQTATTDVLEAEGDYYSVASAGLKCKFVTTSGSGSTRKLTVTNSGGTCAIGTFASYKMLTKVSDPGDYITGLVQSMYPTMVDLELSVYNDSIGTNYLVGKNKPLADYINAINTTMSTSGTPTGNAVREAKYYFQQSNLMTATGKANVIGVGDYTKDPYYEPGNLVAPCRKSFVLLISDGQWNSGIDPVINAYDMRKNDVRPLISDKQTVATYTVYAFGDGAQGRQAMITTALFGGFDDQDLNGWPYGFTSLPSSLTTTYPRPNCNPSGTWNASCAEWDKDKTGLPYNFFEADDGNALKVAITKAINDILGRTASGAAASVMGNNESSGALLLQALYFPEKQFEAGTKAKWLGEVQSLWYYISPQLTNINIREDTIQDTKLRLSEDRIASFDFNGTQTSVNLYVDANADGAADTPASPVSNVSVDEVKALWRAGSSLWSRTSSDRTIFTNNPTVTTYQGAKLSFVDGNNSVLSPYLDISSNNADATDIINYVRGNDIAGYRSRSVTIGGTTNVWKLGDVINSSPRLLTQVALNTYDSYGDTSYKKYTGSNTYKERNVAFVGANDGMLHAFKLGRNYTGTSAFVSELKNGDGSAATDLGKELWGFIPKNSLPYLKHLGNPSYRHLYYVNATPRIIDAAIGQTKQCPPGNTCTPLTCTSGLAGTAPAYANSYYSCPKVSTINDATKIAEYDITSDPTPDPSLYKSKGTSWRTVLLGSMGFGGGTRDTACTNCVKTPLLDGGYSSYFALDITNPESPELLWEFSHPRLGFSSVGPAVLRLRDPSDTSTPLNEVNSSKNGRWYVVLASGPTGPIDIATNQMKALSDQSLSLFVLDLKTGTPLRTFSPDATALISGVGHTQVTSMPSNAYGGTFSDATIDTDKWDNYRTGAYSDDALYLGYARKDTTVGSPSLGKFAKGGVLRLLTGDDVDLSHWTVSTVIEDIGPVTSSIVKLQNKSTKNLWLYFGTGRYNYKIGTTIDEDYTGQREAIYGIKEPCYIAGSNDLSNISCATSVTPSALVDQTSTVTTMNPSDLGWKINLALAASDSHAQRIVTNPVATSLGVLFFVAMKPSSNVCSYGGSSSLWAVNYDNGGPVSSKIRGTAALQQSNGATFQINLSVFSSGGRESGQVAGVPSQGQGSEPPITSNANHFPSKKVLHIQER